MDVNGSSEAEKEWIKRFEIFISFPSSNLIVLICHSGSLFYALFCFSVDVGCVNIRSGAILDDVYQGHRAPVVHCVYHIHPVC